MKLSDYFTNENIYKDGTFKDLGYSFSKGKNILTFCDNIYYFQQAQKNSNISAVIVKKEMLKFIKKSNQLSIAFAKDPRDKFFQIYEDLRDKNLFKNSFKYGISKSATIAKSAIISKNSYIGANTVIEDNVVIKDNVYIGDNCYIDVGTIIGSDGILYRYDKDNNTKFIKHAGSVKIGNSVTLLANSVVVKSLFVNMPTTIEDHSIIGISSTIGHEAYIGSNVKVLGNCVVAKNAKIGNNSIIGSSSVIRENITIGKNADIKAGSIVIKDVAENSSVSGNFAIKHTLNVKEFLNKQKG